MFTLHDPCLCGRVIGCVRTSEQQKQHFFDTYPAILAWPYYVLLFLFKRVLPKLKLTKGRLTEAIDKTLEKSDVASRRSSTTQLRRSILNKSLFYARLSKSVKGLPAGQYAVLFLVALHMWDSIRAPRQSQWSRDGHHRLRRR